jgi:hypothetical protein
MKSRLANAGWRRPADADPVVRWGQLCHDFVHGADLRRRPAAEAVFFQLLDLVAGLSKLARSGMLAGMGMEFSRNRQ